MNKKILFALSASFLLISVSSCGENSTSTSEISPTLELTDYKTIQDFSNSHHCPSNGTVKALVVPVHFKDVEPKFTSNNILDTAFNGVSHDEISCDWTSVKEFYKQSSYNKLDFEFVISDIYTTQKDSSYYDDRSSFNGDGYNTQAAQAIYNEVLTYFDDVYNYKDFDSDNDGYIDAIYMIYDHDVDWLSNDLFYWAYTAKNSTGKEFDGVKGSYYVWGGYDFLKKDDQICNTHTFIHETAHLFGIDDYYHYNAGSGTKEGGLAGADLMDNDDGKPCGDHNSYTKALLGWMKPIVINSDDITLNLKPLQDNNEVYIISSNFDVEKGLFQEYLMLEYYTPTKLQEFDKPFKRNGVRILHICSQLDDKGHMKYNNTSTSHKVISQITTSDGGTYVSSSVKRNDSTLFYNGKTLETFKFTDKSTLNRTIKVSEVDDEKATIIIAKK